jgi:hypothetical protein
MAWVWSAAWGWRADALNVLAQNDGSATMYMPKLPAAAAVCCHKALMEHCCWAACGTAVLSLASAHTLSQPCERQWQRLRRPP